MGKFHYALEEGHNPKSVDYSVNALKRVHKSVSLRFDSNTPKDGIEALVLTLSKFEDLKTLNFGHNRNIKKGDIEQLHNNLPKCGIIHNNHDIPPRDYSRLDSNLKKRSIVSEERPRLGNSSKKHSKVKKNLFKMEFTKSKDLDKNSQSDSGCGSSVSMCGEQCEDIIESPLINNTLQQISSNSQVIVLKQGQCKSKTHIFSCIAGISVGLAIAYFVLEALTLTSYVAIGAVYIGTVLAGSIIACSVTKLCENKVNTKVDNLNATPHNVQRQEV